METNKIVNIKEIAKLANVSVATVDRVLHDRTGVSKETTKKIKDIIKKFNYQPNVFARRLASGKAISLVVVSPKVPAETAYWDAMHSGFEKAENELKQYGVQIQKVHFDANDRLSFQKACNKALKMQCDGYCITPLYIEEAKRFTQVCNLQKKPVVFLNSDVQYVDSLCYIGPDLFHSGYLAAHLISYMVPSDANILILNIAKQIEPNHYTLRKEEGFRNQAQDTLKNYTIHQINIQSTSYQDIKTTLDHFFQHQPDIAVTFVTNSRVSDVAQYFDEYGKKSNILIGYDSLPINLNFLQNGIIDFLICQKPKEQGFQGLFTLYKYLSFNEEVKKVYFMPIDILTKENYLYYSE